MHHQSKKDRMDESLGMRRGKESTKHESMKSRRHESEGMKEHHKKEHHKDGHMMHESSHKSHHSPRSKMGLHTPMGRKER